MTDAIKNRRIEIVRWAGLIALPQFVIWRAEDRDGHKPSKVPYAPNNPMVRASVTDPATWGTYEQALSSYATNLTISGIGFVLVADASDPITAIDLDDAVDTSGIVAEWARPIIEAFNSYTELSPSGTGVHVLVKGVKPQWMGTRSALKGLNTDGTGGIEIYDNKRYIALTGWPVHGYDSLVDRRLEPRQALVEGLCNKLWSTTRIPVAFSAEVAVDHDTAAKAVATLTADVGAMEMVWRRIRCSRYLDSIPPAISGQRGHDATFRAACELFRFGLNTETASKVLQGFNDTRCTPPWSSEELLHKLRQGRRAVVEDGTFGSRLAQHSPKVESK